MIFIHMYRMTKGKTGKLLYGALITCILMHKNIDFSDAALQSMINVEIGKKIFDKMMLKITYDGWVNPKDE
ncbi:hypothetical protein EUGRSUZ_H02682 [Eucalyptus grandis]|uniref:Uncharacterized protein n=2 Tax=Eucalyptus grandis TaxID=71139 RepID=A0ACC3JTA0_EUCGR|nr:hypothetical protein EUGRSUZ_H02682 [Eucalyptus grandis]